MILALLMFIQMAQAQWFDQGWNLEAAFGITNQEITNPNTSKAVYAGYGGHALVYYPLFQNENYSFGPSGKYFYSELKNKANTSTLTEDIKFYGIAPGLELRIYNLFIGYNYRYQWLSIDMSGTIGHEIQSRGSCSEFVVGIEIPWNSWASRFYYTRSSTDLPITDTGLSNSSPWAEENVFLALRYRFGRSPRSDRSYENADLDQSDTSSSSSSGRTPYRSIRYNPRPSTRLNY